MIRLTVFSTLALAGSLSLLEGCLFSGKEGGTNSAGGRGPADMRLTLKPAALIGGSAQAAPPRVDSIVVRVTAADMEPSEFSFAGDSLAVSLPALPGGSGRLVSAALFRKGRLLYAGSALCDLQAGKRNELGLRCDPQFSRVSARFHLPLAYRARISGGTLAMTGEAGVFLTQMAVQGEFGSFLLDELPGNARYDVSLSLDSADSALFRAGQAGVFLPLGEEARWDLPLNATGSLGIPPTGGGAGNGSGSAGTGVGIELGQAKESLLLPGFPSGKRRPAAMGEAVISEFYAAPSVKDSSTEGEWWELFNRTADTLLLDSCRLSQGRSEAVTKSYRFSPGQTLLPGRAASFGRSAARVDLHYQDFALVNTSTSLLLLCAGDALTLDSLRYSTAAADSATLIRARDGQVSSLNPDRLGQSALPSSWCLTKMGAADSTGPGWASPGSLTGNCPE